MEIKIATWNISGGVQKDVSIENYFDQEKSTEIDQTFLNEIEKIIKKEKIDILCLQEVITTDSVRYAEKLSKNTELVYFSNFELGPNNLVKDTECGNATLSKYPIIFTKGEIFTNPKLSKTTASGETYYTFDKGCLVTEIRVHEKNINVINCHGFPFRRFNSTPQENLGIFKELFEIINRYDNPIVAGDFNVEDIMSLLPSSVDGKLVSLFGEITTTDGKSFDNILLDSKFFSISKKTIELKSDHFLCIATIRL